MVISLKAKSWGLTWNDSSLEGTETKSGDSCEATKQVIVEAQWNIKLGSVAKEPREP